MEFLTLAAGVLLALVLQPVVEVPIALFVTRRKVRQDIDAAKQELFAKLDTIGKPGLVAGGTTGSELRAMRTEREIERARTEATILAELADRFGEFKAKAAWNFVPSHIKKAALAAGDDWLFVLQPVLDKLASKTEEAVTTSWNS